MIKLKNVTVVANGYTILKDLTLRLKEKRIAVIGANGSGKSTFARLLNGLKIPNSGTVYIDNLDSKKNGKDIRRKVGFIFQNPDNQLIMPVVEEDLAFGMKNIGLHKDEIIKRIDSVLEQYNLSHIRLQPVQTLSGGQKQLLSLCGVLTMEPEIIVFDEPTTQLDLRNKRKITQTILSLSQQIIVVSHDLEMLTDFDRILVFDEGKIVCDDVPDKAIPYYLDMMA
ncbi:energy-coupling factor ABC transporter ATP-binding protein [Bartonella tamiae]|uniref:ABC transporter domain-containing protein n=1 Tax=Bartonella tamiae Th239 TaxID=1094558 RepID=J0ZS54_9HYPH|nr:ABC transporter ATP-binding protein [Bartonella tamiae]EJF91558.1 hypothetical protein ME5_00253 [Bartonella tamiae Th239]EJF92458.1 hypothetical protein MEG_01628 [Bartonella tamiae Th307]